MKYLLLSMLGRRRRTGPSSKTLPVQVDSEAFSVPIHQRTLRTYCTLDD